MDRLPPLKQINERMSTKSRWFLYSLRKLSRLFDHGAQATIKYHSIDLIVSTRPDSIFPTHTHPIQGLSALCATTCLINTGPFYSIILALNQRIAARLAARAVLAI